MTATTTEALLIEADAYVVVDCLRATTTIATLFARNLSGLWVAADIDDARQLARDESALLFGEVDGLPPEGFDHGNSPVEASELDVAEKRAVLFTTNGTLALAGLAGRGAVFAASPVNASAIAEAVAPYDSVAIVCAGVSRGTRFALEDFAAAACLVELLLNRYGECELGDLALLASELPAPLALIPRAAHAANVRSLGLGADIDFAATLDLAPSVPRVVSHTPRVAYLESGAGTRAE